jgi:hypothetical protein
MRAADGGFAQLAGLGRDPHAAVVRWLGGCSAGGQGESHTQAGERGTSRNGGSGDSVTHGVSLSLCSLAICCAFSARN